MRRREHIGIPSAFTRTFVDSGLFEGFSSTPFGTNRFFDVSERIFGSVGIADAPYSGPMQILCQKPCTWVDNALAKSMPGKFASDEAFTDNLRLADAMKIAVSLRALLPADFTTKYS